MTRKLTQIINNNQQWAAQFEQSNPGVLEKLSAQQKPHFFWIGCADSRVPSNTIAGLAPGEVFVHRNVANQVNHNDLSIMAALEFAIKGLKVTDIVLCGHYECGGVIGAMQGTELKNVEQWVAPIHDTYQANLSAFAENLTEKEKVNLLCELNVKVQVKNICQTPMVQQAWQQGQQLSVHGVIYNLKNGLLKNLDVSVNSLDSANKLIKEDDQ